MATLFISATTKGLKTYRIAATEKLRQMEHTVIVQDEFPMVHEKIAPMLADQIAPCDAVILLIGPVFGAKPADWPHELPWRSYTQLEYDIALELQKPVFRFIATEHADLDSFEPDADPHRALQADYVRSMADYLYWTFSTQAELLTALEKSQLAGFARHNLPQLSLGSLFKGRRDTLPELHRTLVRSAVNKAVITANQTIAGMGGVGKTRLTLEYAWQFGSEYSARLYVKADSPSNLRQNLAELAGTLDVAVSASLDEQLQGVRKWLRTNARWLLILDNVDTEDAKNAVMELLPQLTNGHVLITSRLATWSGNTDQITLDVLSEPAAVDFLLERTASQRRITHSDAADAAFLSRQLGHLPLALEQAGAFITKNAITFADYSQRWQAQEHKILGWNKDLLGRYDRSVLTTWAMTFDQLDSDGRGILQLLCWLAPDPIPTALIEKQAAAPGVEPLDKESGVANLVDYSFLKRSEDKQSVSMHRLVQEIAQYQLPEAMKPRWLASSLQMVNDFCTGDPHDVRTWPTIYTPAYPHVTRILQSADKAGIAAPTVQLMSAIAAYLRSRADFTEAEPLFRRALLILETSYGLDHPIVALSLNNLAALLCNTNRVQEAEPLLRRALLILETSYGPDHPDVAMSLNNLAKLLRDTNRVRDAEPLYRRALLIFETSYGPDHPNVATNLGNLAGLLYVTNRVREAEPLYRRALLILETSYSPDHPNVATGLNNLAELLCNTNRVREAEPLFRRALLILETSYGPDHPNVATSLNNLAALLCNTNRLTEAEPLFRRAILILETSYGPDHPDIATSLNCLAQLLRNTNRVREAESLFRRAILIDEASYGPDHPNVATSLNNLAGLLGDTNRLTEAEPLFRRALLILETSYGPDHPDVATGLNNLALVLRDTNCIEDAEPLFRRALLIDEASYGPDHPSIATSLNNLAGLLSDTNRLTEAEPLHRRAIQILETSHGPDHPNVATSLNNLALVLRDTNRIEDAEPLFRRALAILVQFQIQTGHEHPNFALYKGNYEVLLGDMALDAVATESRLRELLRPLNPE